MDADDFYYLPARLMAPAIRDREISSEELIRTHLKRIEMLNPLLNSVIREERDGYTHNPYDLSRTPRGSSGGEAATIAAGGSPLGISSDSGGSLRQPAHC